MAPSLNFKQEKVKRKGWDIGKFLKDYQKFKNSKNPEGIATISLFLMDQRDYENIWKAIVNLIKVKGTPDLCRIVWTFEVSRAIHDHDNKYYYYLSRLTQGNNISGKKMGRADNNKKINKY